MHSIRGSIHGLDKKYFCVKIPPAPLYERGDEAVIFPPLSKGEYKGDF